MKKQTVTDKLRLAHQGPAISAKFLSAFGYIFGAIVLFTIAHLIAVNLAIALFLLCLVGYLKFLYRDLNLKPYRLLNLILLFLLIVSLSSFILRRGWSAFFIPFGILPLLATLLFSEIVVSFMVTLASSLTVASLSQDHFGTGVVFLIGGILASLFVFGSRRRNTIINAGIIVGLAQAAALFFLKYPHPGSVYAYLIFIANGLCCGIIVLGVLPVFEYLFGTITNIKLLELADFNSPLLNRLMLEAPGTYHHSLIVGNLAEAAAKVVGVNSLLARIGAYYHDIGKLQKPDYFSENQFLNDNLHEALAPHMSKLVIMNHVKEGVELAKKYRLNPRLIEFIQQHHGTSLVYFFYRRALENSAQEKEVAEEGFRYPGPRPNTKEAAIVLLADSVEAAARTLEDTAAAKIEELVHKIINNKFIDGQLDECDLTLKDLELIANVFVHILSGIYHSRINYPEAKSGEDNHKKSAKDNSRQSAQD